ILLARPEHISERFISLTALPGVVLLERPVYTRTLISAAQAGLRARQRQYAMRAQLEQIRLANEELSQAARGKDEFLATLSHELRNPLSAMSGAVRLLNVSDSNSEPAAFARQVIGRQTQLMTRLLDDLLDVARIT